MTAFLFILLLVSLYLLAGFLIGWILWEGMK